MTTRRSFLASALTVWGVRQWAAARQAVNPHTTPASALHGPAARATPANAANLTHYEFNDVRRYGVLANSAAAASANTAALRALVAQNSSFGGTIRFPNGTGADVYHLDDIIPFRDGIHLDLQGSTLHFSKKGERADTNSGFIFAIRDFTIENGSIVVDYQMAGGGTNAGSALAFGNRGTDSQYFSPLYDSTLATPMGNIAVRNLRITSNTAGGNAIFMIGGLNGVLMENVVIDGGGVLVTGIYYEFGWATDEPQRPQRQTSHAHNMRFVNISISNIDTARGQAFGLTGAYNCSIDGLYVSSSKILFQCSPGESAFYRPWAPVDQIGVKRNMSLRNVVGIHITGTALSITGASLAAGGYLNNANLSAVAQTDLIDFAIDGFAIDGADLDGGYGIQSSAEKMDVRNGKITRFSRGIVTTDECTRMNIEGVDINGCRQWGMELAQGFAIWKPTRQKMGFVRGCFIAGNGTSAPGNFAAIKIDNCASFFVEGNRLGYDVGHDGVAEGTQGFGVRLGANAHNVICRGNYVGGVHNGGFAYFSFSTGDAHGNTIENAAGLDTVRGAWLELPRH